MKIFPRTVDTPYEATVELNPTEVTALRAALGEICFGFNVPNFEVRMGSTEAEARQLFEKMDRLATDRVSKVVLTIEEIRLLKKAHEETLRELGVEEYQTRTGVDFTFGQALLKQFAEASGQDGSTS